MNLTWVARDALSARLAFSSPHLNPTTLFWKIILILKKAVERAAAA